MRKEGDSRMDGFADWPGIATVVASWGQAGACIHGRKELSLFLGNETKNVKLTV